MTMPPQSSSLDLSMNKRKIFKIVAAFLCLVIILVGIFVWIYKDDIYEAYKASENARILITLATESDISYQAYRNATPEKAIEALNRFVEKSEYALENFDESNKWRFIDKSTIIGELVLAHGRLSLKYLELNNHNKYQEHIQKALYYSSQYKYLEDIQTEEEIIRIIKKIDETYSTTNKE
jgi:hypothetical protein